MAERTREGADVVYEVTAIWRDRCLRDGGSLFTPTARIWSADHFEELDRRFVQRPDAGADSFLDKLAGQLDGASPGSVQLAAELLYVYFLVTVMVGGVRKRQIVQEVLGWMPDPPAIDPRLDRAFDHGLVNPGTFFNTRRDAALTFLILFGQRWCSSDADERARLFGDPWTFKQMVWSLPVESAFTQRNALLHLVHPATFEPVVSEEHKRLIAERLGEHVGDPTADIDDQLLQIRRALDPDGTRHLDFYDDGVSARWAGSPAT